MAGKLLTKDEKSRAAEALLAQYPDAKCELSYDTVYHLLVAVVLSAQTTDVSVNKVTPKLFEKAPDAFAMAELSEDEIASYIRSIGMYKTKSKNVLALSKMLCEKYEGEVPGDFDKLTDLPGVGRKTANVVLAEAFGEQRIAVDTHVFRLANRIGFCDCKDANSTEEALMKALSKEIWTPMHHALIWHGRRCCSAQNPCCSECPLDSFCKKRGVIKSK